MMALGFVSKSRVELFLVFGLIVIQICFQIQVVRCDSVEDNELDPDDDGFIPRALRHILTDEVAEYEIPEEVTKNFVYYLSGFDDEKRPVWIVEAGRWDVIPIIEEGGEMFKQLDRFVLQIIYRLLNSTQLLSTQDAPVTQGLVLVDMDEFSLDRLKSLPTIKYVLGRYRTFLPAFVKLHTAFIVNTNFIGETALNLLKPILGREFNKLEVYGTNRAKWIPRILRKIPRDQLPEWYGGAKGFRPYQIYG